MTVNMVKKLNNRTRPRGPCGRAMLLIISDPINEQNLNRIRKSLVHRAYDQILLRHIVP